mmetsp:Transcript_2841/g.9545  ORF Transcript_2841/g.9545 Transcript_2841/m.9545 type:complete len:1253 (-) Transcript_2841:117-3875(-)
MSARLQQIAKESVRKKDDRGENLIISLDGRKRDAPLKDEDFVALAPHIFTAVKDFCVALARSNKIAHVEFHGECNECRDKGAAAICGMLIKLRQSNLAAVRAIFFWKNELGDEGAKSVAELVAKSTLPGQERFWVAEVHLSHNNITAAGAFSLFEAATGYPRSLYGGLVPLWLRLEHNAIDISKIGSRMPRYCRAENRGDRTRGLQRAVHDGNCGVSQCCQANIPALHLHLFDNQDRAKVERARSNVSLLNRRPASQSSPPSQLSSQKGYGVPARENYNDTNVKTFQADEFPALPGARAAASSPANVNAPPQVSSPSHALIDSRTKESSKSVKDSAAMEQNRGHAREQQAEKDAPNHLKPPPNDGLSNGTKTQILSNPVNNHRWPNLQDVAKEVNGDGGSSQSSILPSPPLPLRPHPQAPGDSRDFPQHPQSSSIPPNQSTLYKPFMSKQNSQPPDHAAHAIQPLRVQPDDTTHSLQPLHVQPQPSPEQQNFLYPIKDSISSQPAPSSFSELASTNRPYNNHLLPPNLNDFEGSNDFSSLPSFNHDSKSSLALGKELVPVGKEWLSPSLSDTKYVDLEPLQPDHARTYEDEQLKDPSMSSLSSQLMDLSWKSQPSTFNELVKPHAFTQGPQDSLNRNLQQIMQEMSSHQGNGHESSNVSFSHAFPNNLNGSLHSSLPAFPSSAMSLSEVEDNLAARGQVEQSSLSWEPNNAGVTVEQQRKMARSEDLKKLPDACMRWNHEGRMFECRVELNKYKLVSCNLAWPLNDSDVVEIWPIFVSMMERRIMQLDPSKDFIIFVDVSFEENNLGDLAVMTVCQGLGEILKRPRPNVWLRSLDFAFNFVSDVGCLHISQLMDSNLRTGSDAIKQFLADKSKTSQVPAPSITLRLSYNCISSSGANVLAEKLCRYNAKFSSQSKGAPPSALNAKMQIGYNKIDMRMVSSATLDPQNEKRDDMADIDWGYHAKPRQFMSIDLLDTFFFELCLKRLHKTRTPADVPLLIVPDTTSFLRMMQGEYGKPPDLNIHFLQGGQDHVPPVMIVMIGSVYRSLWHLVESHSTTQSDRVAILHLLGTCLNKAHDASKILLLETDSNFHSTQKQFEEMSNVSHWKSSPSIATILESLDTMNTSCRQALSKFYFSTEQAARASPVIFLSESSKMRSSALALGVPALEFSVIQDMKTFAAKQIREEAWKSHGDHATSSVPSVALPPSQHLSVAESLFERLRDASMGKAPSQEEMQHAQSMLSRARTGSRLLFG